MVFRAVLSPRAKSLTNEIEKSDTLAVLIIHHTPVLLYSSTVSVRDAPTQWLIGLERSDWLGEK
jgi:hypothetical protein